MRELFVCGLHILFGFCNAPKYRNEVLMLIMTIVIPKSKLQFYKESPIWMMMLATKVVTIQSYYLVGWGWGNRYNHTGRVVFEA